MKYLILFLTFTNTLALLAQENTTVAGHVAMSVGEVEIIKSNGQRISAQRRSEVMEGDILETGQNGIVHIRFIDEALVAVSCKSTLKIQQYRTGDNEIVELVLIDGSIRSITGTITPAKYILHTELADVRVNRPSTDFRVSGELQTSSSFGVFNGGIRVENNYGTLDLGIGGDFDFAEANKDQPPIGLAIASNTIPCN